MTAFGCNLYSFWRILKSSHLSGSLRLVFSKISDRQYHANNYRLRCRECQGLPEVTRQGLEIRASPNTPLGTFPGHQASPWGQGCAEARMDLKMGTSSRGPSLGREGLWGETGLAAVCLGQRLTAPGSEMGSCARASLG